MHSRRSFLTTYINIYLYLLIHVYTLVYQQQRNLAYSIFLPRHLVFEPFVFFFLLVYAFVSPSSKWGEVASIGTSKASNDSNRTTSALALAVLWWRRAAYLSVFAVLFVFVKATLTPFDVLALLYRVRHKITANFICRKTTNWSISEKYKTDLWLIYLF